MWTSGRAVGAAAAVVLAVVAMAGCATGRGESALVDAATTEPAPLVLTTGAPVTVIDRGDGAELCLGGVMQSLPPGCAGGVELVGWDWADRAGEYEERGAVRWGDFIVEGVYDADADALAPTAVTSGIGYEWPATEVPLLPTRCPEPEGGWRILDEATATYETLGAVTAVASSLEGFATAWVDRSLIPSVPEGTSVLDELHHNAVTAGLTIVNVGLRGDAAAAEELLRQTWGGALCVFTVDYTQAELDAVAQELIAVHEVTGLHADGMTGTVKVSVVYDVDGEIQREVDETYGPGLVHVWSLLSPA